MGGGVPDGRRAVRAGLAAIGGALEFIPGWAVTAGLLAIGVSFFGGYGHPWLVAAFVLVGEASRPMPGAFIMGRGIEIHPAWWSSGCGGG